MYEGNVLFRGSSMIVSPAKFLVHSRTFPAKIPVTVRQYFSRFRKTLFCVLKVLEIASALF